MQVSENVRELEPSATIAVATLCRTMKAEGREVIDLSAGEPDFRTPDFASQAGIAAIVQGFTHYTPVPGTPALRDLIAQHLARIADRPIDPAAIVVTAGAKQALFNASFVLFGPGDEVLLPTPYWTSYPELIRLARARPVLVPTDEDSAFKVTPDDLEATMSPCVRGLVLNSPSNPTGSVYTLEEIDALVRWAAERDVWVISDEIYGRIAFDVHRAPSVLDLDPALLDRVVLVDGVSKSFAMTGWRVGFSWSDVSLASRMSALQSHISSNVSTPAQYAAMAAFRPEPRVEHAVRAMVGVFRHRRERVASLFAKHLPDARFVTPGGAFYLFFRTDAYYRDGRANSVEFCRWLLTTTGVALVPGIAFGDDRFCRLSFAAPEDEITEAIRRMGDVLSVATVPS
jgi:aspartate aminotransferase